LVKPNVSRRAAATAVVPPLRSRQVHLDFHTGPWVPDVGRDFDARDFAGTMKAARVNSVTVFAKCHHGHLYYDTKRPERHPGLKPGLDLLGEQVEALHREGIRAPIYVSVQCDEYAADTHPEWVARQPDGKPVGAGPLSPGWQILDMSSPYQEFLAEQTREVLRKFKPVDGIFFDMCWDQPSVGNYAVEEMARRGLDPEKEEDRQRYAHDVAIAYMDRFYRMVKDASPSATVAFNSRPLKNLPEEAKYLAQVEIEALPTGGWGYQFFPKNVRFARNFGLDYLGMTARFHKSWADFGGLKPYAALEYETAQMMAHGAKCSIGDQMHPRGTLDAAAYDLISRVYARVEAREPWLDGARPLSQIGLFQVPSAATRTRESAGGTDEGAVRMLTQLKHQFDVVDETRDLDRYELLILPDAIPLSPQLVKQLRAYVKNGGKLLASGTSGLNADGTESLLPELGIKAHGPSELTTTYIRFGKEVNVDVPPTDHVMYEPGIRVTVSGNGATAVAKVVEPYFNRSYEHFSSHFQTPPDKPSRYAAAVVTDRTAYVAYPVFSAFGRHGNYPYRLLVRNLLERLLPEPLLRVDAPTSTEATVTRQKIPDGRGERTIVHLLQYAPERRTKELDLVEDIVPLFNVPLSLRAERPPRKVYLAPEGTPIPFEHLVGRIILLVPEVRGHAMVVFE
jgi:hypothetical protein